MRSTSLATAWTLVTLWVATPTVAIAAPPTGGGGATAATSDAAGSAVEDPLTITTRVSPDPSHVGDRLELTVVAAFPKGYAVNLPAGLDLSPLHVIETRDGEVESSGEGLRKTFVIAFQYFDVGEMKTPLFSLTYVDPAGEVRTETVPPHLFTVESLLANEPDPKRLGDDPPISIEYPNETAEKLIYGGLAGIALGMFGWWAFSRWRRREVAIVLPPPEPAHVVAYRALDRLESDREVLVEQGEYADYYLRLTEICRGYLHGRFGLDALELTTDEIRRALNRGANIGEIDPKELVAFLDECDLIKFARAAPTERQSHGAMSQVRGWVDQTRVLDVKLVPETSEHSGGAVDVPAVISTDGGPDDPTPPQPPPADDERGAA